MRKLYKKGAALVLTAMLVCSLFPMGAAAAPTANPTTSPTVSYILDPVGGQKTDEDGLPVAPPPASSITKGMSFGGTFIFSNYNLEPTGVSEINVTVSGTGGLVLAARSQSFKFLASSVSDIAIYIPEQDMTYKGPGPVTMNFTFTYKGGDLPSGGKRTVTAKKTITECQVTATDTPETNNGTLRLDSYKLSSGNIKEGQKFTLDLVIKNTGSVTFSNVTATLGDLSAAGLTVDGKPDSMVFPSIIAGGSATLSFPMVCAPKMTTGNQPLSVTISADGASSKDMGTAKFFVPVTGTVTDKEAPGVGTSVPQIIVQSYDYGGASVIGGKVFTLSMIFKNTSPNIAIENLKMTLAAAADDKVVTAFTPANASNTFFLPKIAAGATFEWKIDLLPKADAEPKPYGLKLDYIFEAVVDGKRVKADTGSETIAIPLDQPDRFTVNDANIYGPIYMGDSGQVDVSYVNMGKSKIFNLAVKVTGEGFTSTDGDAYVGNVESGTGDSYVATLIPSQTGTLTGKVAFTYEDASGNIKTVEKAFSTDVVDMPTGDPGGMINGGDMLGPDGKPMGEPQAGFPVWGWVIIGVGGLAVVLVVVLVVRKKIKKKKLRKLDEDDDYDEAPPTANGPQNGGAK